MKSFESIILFTLILAVLFLPSCNVESNREKIEHPSRVGFAKEVNRVDTILLHKTDFNKEIISNGKLSAFRKANLNFSSDGEIVAVFVKNGDYVNIGAPIARLNSKILNLNYEQSKEVLERARFDLKDKILGFGYGTDTNKLPKDLLKVAMVRSGYTSALQEFYKSKISLSNAILRAPFSGVIANLSAKPYEQSIGTICTLVDNSAFEVNFSVLESELEFIKVGQKIKVMPFNDMSEFYIGIIKSVNPLVDSQGQVNLTASISGRNKSLIDGMNVKVIIEDNVKNQYVVPKSAVVMRDGLDVLFTYDKILSKATWVYVDILYSNSKFLAVTGNKDREGVLKDGDAVIISGNLNLADGSKVKINR